MSDIPDEQQGHQVVLVVRADEPNMVETHTIDNCTPQEVEQCLRMWRRPAWLRRGEMTFGCDATCCEGVTIRWKDLLDLRVQPQLEVIW